MTNTIARKHKIELNDYAYQRDIANRLLLGDLRESDITILEEIIDGSLKITVKQLAHNLDIAADSITPLLQRLESVDLLKIEGDTLLINKEMRKYYSCELAKFSEAFTPDLQHLQALLSKVPIHVLPLWYVIPRTSDNIFQSILEKYFQTPRIYQKYFEELALENANLYRLFDALQQSPDFSLSATKIREMFNLSHYQFHEWILSFEYHLGGSLCYRSHNGVWEEYVTLYQEWKHYQNFLRNHAPISIQEDSKDTTNVELTHPSDFGFIEDLAGFVRLVCETPQLRTPNDSKEKFQHSSLLDLCHIARHLHLLSVQDSYLIPNNAAITEWLAKSKQDQAADIYCQILSTMRHGTEGAYGCTERDFRETEKSLKRVAHSGWVYFDDFCRGSTAAIGKNTSVTLQQKGKKWRYSLPEYDEAEQQILYNAIYKHLYPACLVATGTHMGRPCFRVTPYGRMSLGD